MHLFRSRENLSIVYSLLVFSVVTGVIYYDASAMLAEDASIFPCIIWGGVAGIIALFMALTRGSWRMWFAVLLAAAVAITHNDGPSELHVASIVLLIIVLIPIAGLKLGDRLQLIN